MDASACTRAPGSRIGSDRHRACLPYRRGVGQWRSWSSPTIAPSTPTTTTTRRSTPSPATSTRRWGPRTIQWAEIDGRKYHVLGGKVSRAVVNPTFDPVASPGVLKDYFRGNPNGDNPLELLKARDRIKRRVPRPRRPPRHDGRPRPRQDLAVPDPRHGLRGGAQARPRGRRRRCSGPSTAGSRRTGASTTRTASSPRPTSRSPTSTSPCSELEWALDNGARTIVMRPAAPTTVAGSAPADRSAVRPVLGPGERGRHHRRRPRR